MLVARHWLLTLEVNRSRVFGEPFLAGHAGGLRAAPYQADLVIRVRVVRRRVH